MAFNSSILQKGKLVLITILVAIVVILNLFILNKVLKGSSSISTNKTNTLITN